MQEKFSDAIKLICHQAKQAAAQLAQLTAQQKQQALLAMAAQIEQHAEKILAVNAEEVRSAIAEHSAAFVDRLTLNQKSITSMAQGIKKIAQLPEPVGKILTDWGVASGLHIKRVSVPLGVIAVIYESRPNVTADAAALCLKSGNAIILRGGSECARSNKIIAECIQAALVKVGLDQYAVQYLPTQDRAAIDILLAQYEDIDVVIPRGGKQLIQRVVEVSKIPVFHHLEGICHTYVHEAAKLAMACKIILNAKMRRPGICGATETILIDHVVAKKFLPDILQTLFAANCEVRGDETVQALDSRVKPATEADWSTEYLDAIVSIKVVADLDAAIGHINHYGSHHTDAIITEDKTAAKKFLAEVNSAIVMHNCSTQFADGGEFGMGAEIGIATGKLHARGPVGIEQLTTFKYVVEGQGTVRE